MCHFNKESKVEDRGVSKGVLNGTDNRTSSEPAARDPVPIPVPPEPPPDNFNIPLDQGSGTESTEPEVLVPTAAQVPAAPVGRWLARHKPSKRLQESIEQGLLSLHSVLDDVEGDAEYRIQRDAYGGSYSFCG